MWNGRRKIASVHYRWVSSLRRSLLRLLGIVRAVVIENRRCAIPFEGTLQS
jgi:hypothetical protein